MAIRGADGSIILSTKVDTSGVNKGMTSIKSIVGKVGSVMATAFSVRTLWRFSKAAGQMTTQQEANVQRLIDIYGEASHAVGTFIDTNARALGMSKAAATQFSAVYGNLFSVWADQATNAELTNQYLNMTAVIASKTGRTVEDVQERVRSGLLGNTEAIEDLGVFVNIKTIEITEAFQQIADGRSWMQLSAYEQQQVRTLAILEQATQKYGTTVANTTALTRSQHNAAYQDMQATWGQFVNVVLMPVLRVVTQIMNIITAGLRAIAGITGKTIESSQIQSATANDTANAIGGAVDNQEALTDATKKTAKEQKKLLAGFDDIQILSQNPAESGGAGGTGAGAVGGNIADLGLTGGGAGGGEVEAISTTLATLMGVIGASLAALGLWLLFLGNIPWGIGFIVAGAAMFGVSAAALGGDKPTQNASNALSALMGVIGGALVAIGIMLICLGSVAWGIGFIIAGAAALGVDAKAIKDFDTNKVVNVIMMIEGIAAGALLALGIMLLVFNGANPLSIGLIVAGAGLLAITVAQIVAGEAEGKTANMIHTIVAIASAALLALGVILLFTPASWGLAAGLIIAGASGLAAEAALNWDSIITELQGKVGVITAIVSGALLLLGIILLFTPAVGLGVGLLIAGAAGLAAVVSINWNFLVDKVKEIWGNIKTFWNENIAPIFTKEWWLSLAKKCGNGLIDGFEGAINGIITMFEKMINWVVNGLNKIKFDVPDWVPGIGGKTFGFNIPNVQFGRVSIPRLARGAVIPPNREFLAVLGDQKHGTNIEAPAELIKQMAMEAMLEVGAVGQTTKEEHYYLNETELMSIIYKLVKGGERLRGNSLISGGAY